MGKNEREMEEKEVKKNEATVTINSSFLLFLTVFCFNITVGFERQLQHPSLPKCAEVFQPSELSLQLQDQRGTKRRVVTL